MNGELREVIGIMANRVMIARPNPDPQTNHQRDRPPPLGADELRLYVDSSGQLLALSDNQVKQRNLLFGAQPPRPRQLQLQIPGTVE